MIDPEAIRLGGDLYMMACPEHSVQRHAAEAEKKTAQNMIDPKSIKVGKTYRTEVATWTVECISATEMVFVRRDDGLLARFGLTSFAGRIVERGEA